MPQFFYPNQNFIHIDNPVNKNNNKKNILIKKCIQYIIHQNNHIKQLNQQISDLDHINHKLLQIIKSN